MAKARLIELDPRELTAHPANPRQDLGNLDELAETISDPDGVGLLQPIVLAPVDGGYRIVAGHRRNAAAIQAGASKVLCVLRPDLGDKSPEQLAAMLVENEHRKALTPTETARGYEQLAAFEEWTPERIAKTTGRPVAYVRSALALAMLPEPAQLAADRGQLTLEDAAALHEFADQPKVLDRILRRGSTWSMRHAIEEERRAKATKSEADALRGELIADGVKIISKPKGFPYDSKAAAVTTLRDADDQPLDPQQVRARDGFAAIVEETAYSGAQVTAVCLDPEAHGYRRTAYTRYVPPEEAARKLAAEAAEQQRKAALVDAATVRREFLTRTYGGAKAAKGLYLEALRDAVRDPDSITVDARQHDLVTALAGADLEAAATAGEARLQRMLVARWVAAHEDNLATVAAGRWNARRDAALAWLDRIVGAGYELSEIEAAIREDLATPRDPGAEPCELCGADATEDCAEDCPNLAGGWEPEPSGSAPEAALDTAEPAVADAPEEVTGRRGG